MYYILEGHEVKKVDSIADSSISDIAKTNIIFPLWKYWIGKILKIKNFEPVRVSTIFLGLDHSWGNSQPLLFETMVFGGPLDQEQDRYSTWEEAESGHKTMVERVKSAKA